VPIEVNGEIRRFSQDEFYEVDYAVMGVIFDVHNRFGRFLDEYLYKVEIAARCAGRGILPAVRELRIRVSHDTFAKDFFLDMLFCRGAMYEAKTVEHLAPAHRAQTLNYLFLCDLQHGKLVNLRPDRVQAEFVSTTLDCKSRRQFEIHDSEWRNVNNESLLLRRQMIELLEDWGGFLEVALYRDAITHFHGGPEAVSRNVEVYSGDRLIGRQAVHLLTDDTAFAISAVTEPLSMREHQLRFLRHTRLKYVQWINLNRHAIEFRTLGEAHV